MSTAEQIVTGPTFGAEYAQLPRRTQIGLMRRLAGAALDAYDLAPARVTLQAHFFNTTFRVDTATGQRYILRIGRAGRPTVESVSSELAWLTAIRRDTDLEVPEPVQARDGTLLIVASVPEVPQPHICVLFSWLPGKLRRRGLTRQQMERTGELMAHLQNHATQWARPHGFARSRADYPTEVARYLPDPFAPEVFAYVNELVSETLSKSEADVVMKTLEHIRETEELLGQGPDVFGLIHADLHYGNLLFERGTVRAIDFDDCGFGPLLYDPAVLLSAVLGWEEYPALRAGLLEGYRRVRPLTAEHEAHLDTFIALRQVQDALWMLEWRKHPALSADWAADARRALAPLPSLLNHPGKSKP